MSEFKWGEHVEVRNVNIDKYKNWEEAIFIGYSGDRYHAVLKDKDFAFYFTDCRKSDWED